MHLPVRPRRLPLLSRSALAGASALGLFAVLGAGGAAAAASVPAGHGAAAERAAAITALRHLLVGWHGTDHAAATAAPAVLNTVKSSNWSGYADTGGTFSDVSAAWVEPAVTCPSSTTSLAAFWVGIDGYSSKTVEQDGTLAECYKGSAYYASWWELYPTNTIQVVGETVKPGDKITASVVRTGTKYALKVTDATTSGNNVNETASCAAKTCVDSSAEWIAEAPSNSTGVLPLADFGTWSAKSAAVTAGTKSGTISSFTDTEIIMAKNGTGATEAQPGSLTSGGSAFKDTWKSA